MSSQKTNSLSFCIWCFFFFFLWIFVCYYGGFKPRTSPLKNTRKYQLNYKALNIFRELGIHKQIDYFFTIRRKNALTFMVKILDMFYLVIHKQNNFSFPVAMLLSYFFYILHYIYLIFLKLKFLLLVYYYTLMCNI